MRIVYLLLGTLLFVCVLGFALQNVTPVVLHYYLGYSLQAPLSLVLLMTLLLGVVLGLIATLAPYTRQRRELLALKREIQRLKPQD
jgi:lipopolysaccharide assembly protein A